MPLADDILAVVVARLAVAGCVAAAEEAAGLAAAAPDGATLEAWLRRREQGEPVARKRHVDVRVDLQVFERWHDPS